MESKRVYSGAPWEKNLSYCRAIQRGSFVAVSGTTSMKEGEIFAPGDPYAQAIRCLEIIEEALKELSLNRESIVRTRIFVTKITDWELIGKAHGDFFRRCPPATSMVEVKGLIAPGLMVEIEADAIADQS